MTGWPCALDYSESLKRSLDQDYPGWTREEVWCPRHRTYHELTADPGQRPLFGDMPNMNTKRSRQIGANFRMLPGNLACFHESGSSPALVGTCAYCGTRLHVHKDALGRVKSGRHEKGYLEEVCPACHRANAVFPIYGAEGVRTTRLDMDAPIIKLRLSR